MASAPVVENPLVVQLRNSLLQMIFFFSSLGISQRQKIDQLERLSTSHDDLDLDLLSKRNQSKLLDIIRNSSEAQLGYFVQNARNCFVMTDIHSSMDFNDKESISIGGADVYLFGRVFRLLLLQEMLHYSLSESDIVFLKSILPSLLPDQQLHFLQQLHCFFQSFTPESLETTYQSLFHTKNSKERQLLLHNTLESVPDSVILFQGVSALFRIPEWSQVCRIARAFTNFQDIQLIQLVKILRMDTQSILEFRQILSPDGNNEEMMDCEPETKKSFGKPEIELIIVDQVATQAVYKRNLVPSPSVMISQQDSNSLFRGDEFTVTPIIYRCDTCEPIPRALLGDHSQKGKIGSVLHFRKLKVQVTSRQSADALFCVRFVIHHDTFGMMEEATVQTNPIQIVSHSSLIKKEVPKNVPCLIKEIVPSLGNAGTRVAVLGSGFVDDPSLRVHFGGVVMVPEYYGANTLICVAPPISGGIARATVSITVGEKQRSKNSVSFSYEDDPKTFEYGDDMEDHCAFSLSLTEDEDDYTLSMEDLLRPELLDQFISDCDQISDFLHENNSRGTMDT